MAKTLATVSGVALMPGVSRNGRLYTREAIAKAVGRAQKRIEVGEGLDIIQSDDDMRDGPMSQLTHHAAEDDSTRIVGRVTRLALGEDGSARFDAAIADTDHGRTIASLLDTTDGQPPFLKGVSIRGAWLGKVQRVKGPDGQPCETAADLELDGLDYTRKPGVPGAQVTAFEWARGGANETTERVLITESVEEARVTTITEDTTPAAGQVPAELREALASIFAAAPDDLEEASPAMSKRGSGLSGAGRVWADPGYQADKKQRYDLSTKPNAKSAWSYISQKANASKYTPAQLKRVKGRIKAALKRFGVTVAAEGWTIEPAFQVTEALAEMIGDPSAAGSFSLNACNGPVSICISSYCLDPADLHPVLQAACDATCQALAALDPDMDGDIDVPGAGAEDTDDDMDNGDGVEDLVRRLMSAVRGESAEQTEDVLAEVRALRAGETAVTEAAPTPESPAAAQEAVNQGTEAPMTETTTQEAAPATAAPAFTQADVSAAVTQALEADRAARKAAKAAKRAKAAESAPAAPVAETAPAPAQPDIEQLVAEKIAAALQTQGLAETAEQKIARLVEEGVTRAKQEMTAAGGGPSRKGLVAENTAAAPRAEGVPADYPQDGAGNLLPMEKWSEANRRAVGNVLQQTFLGARAEL